jgi:hypothetical protein
MKKLLLPILGLVFLLCGATRLFSWPVYDPFNYPVGQTVWSQYDTNTQDQWYEIDSGASSANAVIITNNVLTYPGLPAAAGYSFLLTNVNGAQGPRMFITASSLNWPGNAGGNFPGPICVFYSLVMNVTNMTALWNNGSPSPQYSFGYNDQGSVSAQGGNPGTMLYRLYWLATSATTYQVCLAKQGPGSADLFYATNVTGGTLPTNASGFIQFNANQNYFIVGEEIITNAGVGELSNSTADIAQFWVNPPASSFGAQTAPPANAIEGPGLENGLTPYTSCIIFENRSASTPVTLIGQFRFGTNWAWVTGGPYISNNVPGAVNFYSSSPLSLSGTPLYNGSPNTFQWCLNGTNLTNGLSISGSGATVSGANSTNLMMVNETAADSGSYTVIVSNTMGAFTSAVSVVTVQAPIPATVTVEPSPATIPLYPGGSTPFSFSATGATPLVYYWYSNTTVVGVTTNSSTFLYSDVQATASVHCLVSNALGTTNTVTNTIDVLPLPTAPYPLAVINDKPIGFWPLSEHPDNGSGNDGTLALDYVGGNDGVYSNTVLAQAGYGTGLAAEYSYSPPSDSSTAAEFGAYPTQGSTNSYVGAISNIDFTASENSPSFSVEAWVNAEGNSEGTSGSTDPAGTIVAKGWGSAASGADEFALEYSGSSAGGGVGWSFYCRDQSGIAFFVAANKPLDTNWHHLVGVFAEPTPTVQTPVMSLYLDGVLLSSNTSYASTGVGTNTIGIYSSTFPLTIGSAGATLNAATNGPDKQWFGDIADVAIYKYALTANQVSNHYWSSGLPPAIEVEPPASVQVSYGGTVEIPVSVAGTAPLTYEWIDGNTSLPVAGQTNATLTLTNATNNDFYTLQVTSPYGSASSFPANVTVVFTPTIVQDIAPSTPTIVVGNSVSFVVDVDGAPPVTYWWQFDGTNLTNGGRISGATSNTLTIANAQLGDAGTYQLFASNSYGGPAMSSQATLTVTPWLGLSGGNTWATESTFSVPYPQNNELELTPDGGNEDTASFYQDPLYIQSFYAFFTYQVGSGANNSANGATFCIQNDPRGATAEGEGGSGLGVGTTSPAAPPGTSPITPSVELEFNIYAGNGLGGVGVSLGTNGSVSNVTSTSPVVINSGDPINVALTYSDGVLTVNLADPSASTQFTMTTNVNIPAIVGGSTAYVGFTGSTGGSESTQLISDFSFQSIPTLGIQRSGNQAVLSWPTDVGYFALQETPSLSPTNWTAVTNIPATVGNQNQVTVTAAGAPQYFRLFQSENTP